MSSAESTKSAKQRFVWKPDQLQQLEKAYNSCPKPAAEFVSDNPHLVQILMGGGATVRNIKYIQNKRSRSSRGGQNDGDKEQALHSPEAMDVSGDTIIQTAMDMSNDPASAIASSAMPAVGPKRHSSLSHPDPTNPFPALGAEEPSAISSALKVTNSTTTTSATADQTESQKAQFPTVLEEFRMKLDRKLTGYQLYMRDLGKEAKGADSMCKRIFENSNDAMQASGLAREKHGAEVLQILSAENKWWSLSSEEQESYNKRAAAE
ncbi:hypothetical protein DFJ73DRAFT_957988, partial [Zopfochytrium polystomum]